MEILGVIIDVVVAIGGSLGILFGVVFFLALVIQTAAEFVFAKLEGILTAIFANLGVFLGKPGFRAGLIAIFTCGLGIWAAFLYQLDLVNLIAALFGTFTETESAIGITVFGLVMTGILMGMGSSYLHDMVIKPLLGRFKPKAGDGPQHAG